jgi:hypothetical protein
MRILRRVAIGVGIACALYIIIGIALDLLLKPGERITLLSFSSVQSNHPPAVRTLPATEGDLLLVGDVHQRDHIVPNAPFVFLFQDGFRTREIKTDSLGRFTFRLPPGDWKFLGPLFVAHQGSVSVVFTPEIRTGTPTFQVRPGTVTKTLALKIALESD